MKIIYRLTTLLNRVDHNLFKDEIIHILSNITQNQFQDTLKYCKRNSCHLFFYKNLQFYLDKNPHLFIDPVFKKSVHKQISICDYRNEYISEISKKFKDNNVPIVFLKGALFSRTIYQDLAYKKMNDFDFLVKKKFINKGLEILENLEFQTFPEIFGNYNSSDKSHHTPPIISKDGRCLTGIHWDLKSPYIQKNSPIESFLDDLKTESFNDLEFYRFSWEANLYHLVTHLPFYKIGIRELADVANLVLLKKIDWEKFSKYIIESNYSDAAYRVLSITSKMFDISDLSQQASKYKKQSHFYTRMDTHSRKGGAVLFDSRSTYIAKIEKLFVLFRISKNPIEKIKTFLYMWFKLFTPSTKEALKIFPYSFPQIFKITLSKLLAPIILLVALIKEHSLLVFSVFTIQNIFITLLQFFKIPFNKEPQIRNHKLFKIFDELE